MEISGYLRVLRRRWISILAITLVVTITAVAITAWQTPRYESTTRLFVSTSSVDAEQAFQGGELVETRLASYVDLVDSREVVNNVIRRSGTEATAAELTRSVSATVANGTVNLVIRVIASTPREAQALAQDFADALVDLVDRLETPAGASQSFIKTTVVDDASLPLSPVWPPSGRNSAFGVLLGLMLGLGLAALRESLDTRIDTAQDLAAVTAAPLLGSTAHDASTRDGDPIGDLAASHANEEAFRVLRTNLQFMQVDTPKRVLLISSALPQEGRSISSVRLGAALAQVGLRTLLLEGDLRRPSASWRLGLDGAPGLSDVLVGRARLDDAIHINAQTGLHVLPAGSPAPSPAELIESRTMHDLMDSLREVYDYILIDGPALLPVTDAALLAIHAHGTIIAVRHGRVTQDQFRAAVERLDRVGSPVLGLVLTMVPSKGRPGSHDYSATVGHPSDRSSA